METVSATLQYSTRWLFTLEPRLQNTELLGDVIRSPWISVYLFKSGREPFASWPPGFAEWGRSLCCSGRRCWDHRPPGSTFPGSWWCWSYSGLSPRCCSPESSLLTQSRGFLTSAHSPWRSAGNGLPWAQQALEQRRKEEEKRNVKIRRGNFYRVKWRHLKSRAAERLVTCLWGFFERLRLLVC